MDPASHDVGAIARKNQQMILKGLSSAGGTAVAKALCVDESTVSRMKEKDGAIERIATLCAIAGLKIVPVYLRCFDPKDVESLLHQAKRWHQHVGSASDLTFTE